MRRFEPAMWPPVCVQNTRSRSCQSSPVLASRETFLELARTMGAKRRDHRRREHDLAAAGRGFGLAEPAPVVDVLQRYLDREMPGEMGTSMGNWRAPA